MENKYGIVNIINVLIDEVLKSVAPPARGGGIWLKAQSLRYFARSNPRQNAEARLPSRYVQSRRELCAARLSGQSTEDWAGQNLRERDSYAVSGRAYFGLHQKGQQPGWL